VPYDWNMLIGGQVLAVVAGSQADYVNRTPSSCRSHGSSWFQLATIWLANPRSQAVNS
jgi:hypothetical protein